MSLNGNIAHRVTPPENVYSCMYSEVHYDWLLSYIKSTQKVLEMFKMAEYFLQMHHNHKRKTFVCNIQRQLNGNRLV